MINLEQGFESYLKHKARQTKKFRKIANRVRKLEREVGPIRFEMQATNLDVLSDLMVWKSAQFRRCFLADLFEFDWVRELLTELFTNPRQEAKAVVSALYAGKHMIAAAYDLQYGNMSDAWFTAFDREFAVYSPGSILLQEKTQDVPATRRGPFCDGSG